MRRKLLRALLMSAAIGLPVLSASAQHTQKNVFAYDIRVNSASPHNPVVTYRLNSTTNSVVVRAKSGNSVVASVNGGTSTSGVNSVTLNIPGNITGTISFEVQAVNAGNVSTPTNVKMGDFTNGTDNYYGWRFNLPIGLAINNATESPVFGQMVVAEHNNMTSTSTAYHSSSWRRNGASNGRGNAIYVFDPQGGAIKNTQALKGAEAGANAGQTTYGFSGNLAMNNNAGEFNRIRFSGDGRLFMYSNQVSLINSSNVKTGNEAGVYMFQSNSNSSAHVADFYNTQVTKVLSLAEPTINASVSNAWSNGFDVVGSGNDTRFGILIPGQVTDNTLRGNFTGNIYKVSGNTASLEKSIPNGSGTALYNIASAMYVGIAMDRDGKGLLISKDTSTPSTTNYGFLYYDINGTPVCEFSPTSGDPYRRVTSVAYNKDGSLLAISTKEGKIFVYQTTSASGGQFGIGSLLYTITSKVGTDGFSVFTDVAFDYANNLYALNRTREYFACWQLPGTTETVVPAPSSQNVTIGTSANFTLNIGDAKWNSDNVTQSVAVSWSGIQDASSYNVYLNGTKVATPGATSATVNLAFNQVNKIYVTPVINGVETTYSSQTVTVYHADYEGLTATAASQKNGNKINAVVTWDKPRYGTVTNYEVRRFLDPTSPAIYDVVYTGQSNTFTDSDIKNKYYYQVVAKFDKSVYPATSPNTAVNQKESNFTSAVESRETGTPSIIKLETYPGRNTVRVHWTLDNDKALADYFTVYRDGEVLMEKVQYREFNDFLLDDGSHSYKIEAVYLLGDQTVTLESEPKALDSELARNHAQTRYGIEEVYNVPILSREEAGGKAAFITDNSALTKNMSYAEAKNETAHRGGLYRQAKFRDGKWYITQIHDFTPAAASDYVDGNTPVAEYTGTETDGSVHGGVIVIDAENEADVLKSSASRIIEYNPNLNQALACDQGTDGLTFVTRSGDGLYKQSSRQLTLHHVSADGNVAGTKNISLNFVGDGRVHYMAADGDLWNGTGHIYMAESGVNRMYVITVEKGAVTGEQAYELPIDLIGGSRDTESENYALPIEGTDDFLWQIRDYGYFKVNVNADGTPVDYQKIHGEDVSHNPGALTFVFDGEVFFAHPVSSFSRNAGNFTVDLPLRSNKQDIGEADFTRLVPILSVNQDETDINIEAVGTNGVWFGTMPGESNDEMFIYVYVPGERFAKYRFYRFADYPAVEDAALAIATEYNDDRTDIRRFAGTVTWNRPAGFDDADEYSTIRLAKYAVTLTDAEGNVLESAEVADDDTSADKTYSFTFETADIAYDTDYTAKVVPVYMHNSDSKTGEGAEAADNMSHDYEGTIGKMNTKSWVNDNNGVYRVDLDFTPGTVSADSEPVSYFTIEYSTDGETWNPIPYLWLYLDGGQLYMSQGDADAGKDGYPVHDNRIPGTYDFDLESGLNILAAAESGAFGDKGRPVDEAGVSPVVGYYYAFENPADNQYRAVAVYAADNDAIRKEYASDSSKPGNPMTTGVDDSLTDGNGSVTLYPVPAHTTVTVRSAQPIATVAIHAVDGSLVKKVEGDGGNAMQIDVSALPAGNYIVIVNNLTPLRLIKN